LGNGTSLAFSDNGVIVCGTVPCVLGLRSRDPMPYFLATKAMALDARSRAPASLR